MPIDLSLLQTTAQEAHSGFPDNVRSGKFVRHFQQYCEQEFARLGLPPRGIEIRPFGREPVKIEFRAEHSYYTVGGYYTKELDLAISSSNSGPLVAVSLKTMMRSVGKNVNNRWEEAVGDAANLHARFPMLALGYLMIVPYASTDNDGRTEHIVDGGGPTTLGRSIEQKLRGLGNRQRAVDLPSSYEEVALCVIDFAANPVTIHPTFPGDASGLRIENFFDRLTARFRERNPQLSSIP